MNEVNERMTELSYQNRFWAQYGGTSGLSGFIEMLQTLEDALPENSPVRGKRACEWLQRLRAVRNIEVIQAEPGDMTGGMDFSAYGVNERYEAGRAAVELHFEKPLAERRVVGRAVGGIGYQMGDGHLGNQVIPPESRATHESRSVH